MLDMPMFRMELEGMKLSMITALGQHNREIEAHVSEVAKTIINDFDFMAEVKPILENCIQENLKNYFRYGKGASLVKDAIDGAFKEEVE